ncbi:MAG: dethiobiotin synthase, partial [Alphaproteobacteria bacterium]|nr:dethiobiotin synthase [Alphaproteobacteria bacterium]
MKTLFVTSSGTGIGKTLVTAALCHQLRQAGTRVRALKPVISGFDAETEAESDTAVLLDSLGLPLSPETIEPMSPWRFAAPLSPDMAAVREGRTLDYDAIVQFCRDAAGGPEDVVLVEGVGGVMVPLTERETVLDWMAAVGAPAAVV